VLFLLLAESGPVPLPRGVDLYHRQFLAPLPARVLFIISLRWVNLVVVLPCWCDAAGTFLWHLVRKVCMKFFLVNLSPLDHYLCINLLSVVATLSLDSFSAF